jgi:DHA1 family inner membrane transport protein
MYSLSVGHERRLLWLLALTQFTVIMDFMVMMPLGPQVMDHFVITPASFATAVSAYSWCSGLSGLFAATYIDRFDRRRLLLTVYGLFAVSNLVCACAPTFTMLLVARAFAGLTGGVLSAVILAIVSDVIPVVRRGAATGTIMTAVSIAAVGGVPAGVLLGAHFGWWAPFMLLTMLSVIIWMAGARLVPSIAEHLTRERTALSQVLPELWRLVSLPRHLNAFGLMFILMMSHMMIVPFMAPVLVANHGVQPAQLSWLYMGGGAAMFFTARLSGRLADRYGKRRVFRLVSLASILPVLFITHLPNLSFIALLMFFPCFMVLMNARMVPMQALFTTVPESSNRGAFLSANGAVQSIAMGCGAWLGGLLLSITPSGHIDGFNLNGWYATALVVIAVIWVSRVKGTSEHETIGEGEVFSMESAP